MAELNGSLTSIGLAPLVRFLGGLNKTGDLLIARGHWVGQLSFVDGQLTAAAVENAQGPEALTFIAAVLGAGDFEFSEGEPSLPPNLSDASAASAASAPAGGTSAWSDPSAASTPAGGASAWSDPSAASTPAGGTAAWLDLIERAPAESAPWTRDLPAPTDVPRLLEGASDIEDSELMLGRSAVYVLLDIDGQRSVRDHAEHHGLVRSLRALAILRDMGLVTFVAPVAQPAADAHAAWPTDATLRDRTAETQSFGREAEAPPHVRSDDAQSRGRTAEPPAPGRYDDAQPPAPQPEIPASRPRFRRGRGFPGLPGISVLTAGRSIPGMSVVAELVQAVLVAGVLVIVTRAFVQNFRVDGVSMLPTFQAGQVLVVNRAAYFHVEGTPLERLLPAATQGSVSYLFGGPQRGDVVVFRAPPQPDADYIKRVIGLPGERVQITAGRVHINGLPLDEPYIRFPADYTFPDSGEPLVVPEASYFVLGDNRPESYDSHLGWVVPVDHLVGRAWVRYWPPTEVAIVEPGRPIVAASRPTP